MRKLYCDRCKKEMDLQKENDIHVWFAFPNGQTEEWDFCEECAMSVKRSIVKNIVDKENGFIEKCDKRVQQLMSE